MRKNSKEVPAVLGLPPCVDAGRIQTDNCETPGLSSCRHQSPRMLASIFAQVAETSGSIPNQHFQAGGP